MRTALSFDDVLLVPKHNNVRSRGDVDLSTNVAGLQFRLPIISANMPSVTGARMANAMAVGGGLGIIHRMCSIEEQVAMIRAAKDSVTVDDVAGTKVSPKVGAAIGIGDDWFDRALACSNAGADVICIDVAHGDQERVIEVARKYLYEFSPGLIVGNIATEAAARGFVMGLPLQHMERVALKVGVGGGSACTTRIQTGFGIPTLQSVMDVARALEGYDSPMTIIADGGIKNSGDICKCLAAGADAVMLGSLLAGTKEAPGDVIKDDKSGHLYKVYRGSASYGAKKDFFSKAEYIEGAERLVEFKGSVEKALRRLAEGVRSGFTYAGAKDLRNFQFYSEFIQITPAGFRESLPHGLL